MDPVFDPALFRYWTIVRGASNPQLGAAVGRSAQTIRNYASGRHTPSRAVVAALANALGVEVTALLDFGPDPEPQQGEITPLADLVAQGHAYSRGGRPPAAV
ncbi:helix-turn-helix domain-containing protein [Streptomyces sp. NPDC004311]|uniref:helix-turn-helix domain-containing protein n=1 Tax=Streptomyces sp. NPDC004311 TaxID=3364698 RepID=UPI0036C63D4C